MVLVEPMGVGGIAQYTYNLCQALAAQGVRTTLITARNYELAAHPRAFRLAALLGEWFRAEDTAGPPSPPRLSVLAIARRRLRSGLMMLRIVAAVLAAGAPVVHLQWPVGHHDEVYLAVLRALGRRVIYTAHDVLPHEHTPDDAPRLRRLLRHVDRVILHSDENARSFRETFSGITTPAYVIPHGNYCLFARPDAPAPARARAALGLPGDARVALFFGAIRPYKGLADLIRVFPWVRAGVPNARLVIAGCPFEDFAPYDAAIDDAGVRDCVATHLGYHAVEDVPTFFRAADAVVLPYRSASQSGVAQLAFAFGLPVVATRVGGLPEVVGDGTTGLLVEPGDDGALAAAMIRLLVDPDLCRAMGDRASRAATARYSWDRIAAATRDVYALAAGRPRSGAPLPVSPAE